MLLRALLLLGLLALPARVAAETVWTMATEYPATAIPGLGVSTFARLVREKTGGQIVIEPSFDAARGLRSAELPEAVRDGRLQAADSFAGALGPLDPLFSLSSLPFVASSLDDAARLAQLSRPAYEAAFARLGQRLLYLTPWPPSGLWSKIGLRSLDDLRRLKVRTYDETSSRVIRALGAQTLSISFADTMPKLKDGSIDAVLSSGDGGAGRRLWEFLPHFTELNYAFPVSVATLSAKAYEELPPEQRAAVDEAGRETERAQWLAMRTRIGENYRRMRDNGVSLETAPDPALIAALRDAAAPAIAEWKAAAGPGPTTLLDRFQAGSR